MYYPAALKKQIQFYFIFLDPSLNSNMPQHWILHYGLLEKQYGLLNQFDRLYLTKSWIEMTQSWCFIFFHYDVCTDFDLMEF